MTQIDFTQPLELVDGTPVKLDDSRRDNPDKDGDYYLIREDGQNFTMAQTGESFDDNILIVRPDGRQWVHELRDRPPVIRNRVPAPAPKGYEAAGDWFAPDDGMTPAFPAGSFYQMREIGGRGYVNPRAWSADKDRTWAHSALSGTAFATTPPTADGRTQSHNTEYRLLRPITVTVPVLTEADIADAQEAWMGDRSKLNSASFFARRWGLFTPEPSRLDRFMAAHPDADRATAEAALNWEKVK